MPNSEAKNRAERKWRAKNKARVAAYNAKYYEAHKEELARKRKTIYRDSMVAAARRWVKANPQKVKDGQTSFRKRNPGSNTIHATMHKAAKRAHTPLWANEFFIEQAYALARVRTRVTGIKWQVDHIVPLRHAMVTGLHTHRNLQVITKSANCVKGNRSWPYMPEIPPTVGHRLPRSSFGEH